MPKQILHTALFHFPHHMSSMLVHADGNLHMAGGHAGGTLLLKFTVKYYLLKLWLSQRSRTQVLTVLGAFTLLPLLTLASLFLMPKTTAFSFASDTCFFNPVLLPQTVSSKSTDQFSARTVPTFSLGNYPVFSNSTCVDLTSMPTENTKHTLQMEAWGLLRKNIAVKVNSLPTPTLSQSLEEPIAPDAKLQFSLDQRDRLFAYSLSIDASEQLCSSDGKSLECELAAFELPQGASYDFSLHRVYLEESEQLFTGNLSLRDPVIINTSSITNGQLVYDAPSTLSLTANKTLSADGHSAKLTYDDTIHPVTLSTEGNTLVVHLDEPLQRQKTYMLQVDTLLATDGAYLAEPYTLTFTTSGGPKVAGINIGGYDVVPSTDIRLSFDVELDANQTASKFVTLTVGGSAFPASYTISGSGLVISPHTAMPACTSFSVAVHDGLANAAGITGGSAWTMQSRSRCKTIFSIGTSVQGRALTAYRYGSGPNTILFVGGMHGNEKSSYRTLIAWVDELERRATDIPADKTIVVIPDINPDAYAASTRTNANTVDLNRNFPSNDWASGIYMPGGAYLENGGGTTALSEPESQALASYTSALSPRLVLTYHAVARAVIANGSGDSIALAGTYGTLSGFSAYDSGHEDALFNYPTTGEYETWLHDKKAIPTLLIELATLGSNELYSQRSAMWAMVNL